MRQSRGGCIEFTGASAAGWSLSTALDVDNMAATVVGVSGSVAGASLAAELVTGTGKFDATVSTAIGGATVALEMTGETSMLKPAPLLETTITKSTMKRRSISRRWV